MSDERVTALLPEGDLRVVVASTVGLCRYARTLAELAPASAEMLAQALTAVALMGALQKSSVRINLQLECDGPLRGVFVDGDTEGNVRGYVKNRHVLFLGDKGPLQWRPVLGNSGFLSVLRDSGQGEYYRSSVELTHFDLAKDLEHYFARSEQLDTAVFLRVIPSAEEKLGHVWGVLLQPLPFGDRLLFQRRVTEISRGLDAAEKDADFSTPSSLLKSVFPNAELEVTARLPLAFRCSCSRERVKRALIALGKDELNEMIEKEGQAEVTCEFCSTRYVVPREELTTLLV